MSHNLHVGDLVWHRNPGRCSNPYLVWYKVGEVVEIVRMAGSQSDQAVAHVKWPGVTTHTAHSTTFLTRVPKKGEKIKSLATRPLGAKVNVAARLEGKVYTCEGIETYPHLRIWYTAERGCLCWSSEGDTWELLDTDQAVDSATQPQSCTQSNVYCVCSNPSPEEGEYGFGGKLTTYQICTQCKKEYKQ